MGHYPANNCLLYTLLKSERSTHGFSWQNGAEFDLAIEDEVFGLLEQF